MESQIDLFLSELENYPSVQVMAASKTQKLEAIMMVHKKGIQHIGENYVQEGLEKIKAYQAAGFHGCLLYTSPSPRD